MTIKLEALNNTSRPYKRRKIVGRGPGSKRGKTCGRGVKGAGARSGYKRRLGTEGGGVPLHRRVPTRGFSNARFSKKFEVINLGQLDQMYEDGETVSYETLNTKGFIKGSCWGIKVLADGNLTKKLIFQVEAISLAAEEKIKALGIDI